MVLLEALTGRPPLSIKIPDRKDGASRGVLTKSAARAYASSRERSARSTIRDSEISAGRSIAPGLRVILERCLDPDPARRYGRASELADDLDRWRSDRPLAFAEEPFWGQTMPRWLRRKRRMLTVAAVSLITVALATTAVVLSGLNLMQYRSVSAGAISKLALKWDVPEAGALVYQRAKTPHLLEPDDPQAIETARVALKDYGILGPKDDPSAGDWRRRDDVRRLPADEGLDLEVWIMERAYRYCWGLENRSRSQADWRRALGILDRVSGPMSIQAFAPMRDRLLARLDSEPPAPSPTVRTTAPPWLDEHLLGFVAECEPASAGRNPSLESADVIDVLKAKALAQRTAAERALRHYINSLTLRPDSYWGHYRASAVDYGLGRISASVGHLEHCLQSRPKNPMLRGQLAACLSLLDRNPEALALCDRAVEMAPNHAEFYRTRAMIRANLGQVDGSAHDIDQFQMLNHFLPVDPLWSADLAYSRDNPHGPKYLAELAMEPWSSRLGVRDESGDDAPEDIDFRLRLSEAIHKSGDYVGAQAELDRILAFEPDHLLTRMTSVVYAIDAHQFDAARRDLEAILNHPGLLDHLRKTPDCFVPLFLMTYGYLKSSRVADAQMVAQLRR